MNSNEISKGILKAIGVMIGIATLVYVLYALRTILLYMIIAAVVALIGRPIVLFLKTKLRFRNSAAAIFTMALFVFIIIGLFKLFIPLVVEQGENLSLLNVGELESAIFAQYSELLSYLGNRNIDLTASLEGSRLFSKIDFNIIPNLFNAVVSGFGSLSIGMLSVIFIAFFFLKDSDLVERILITAAPTQWEDGFRTSFSKIKNLLSRYFIGVIFQIFILLVFYAAVLLILGVKNAVVIAFLCALLNIIPYVGPMIAGVLMIALTMISNIEADFNSVILPKVLWVAVGFMAGQLIDNFFSQPFIFSKSVKSHPLEIFIVILASGLLFGILGMIVAVPAYTVVKVILKTFISQNKIVQGLTKDL